jgi:hypothetical protein
MRYNLYKRLQVRILEEWNAINTFRIHTQVADVTVIKEKCYVYRNEEF